MYVCIYICIPCRKSYGISIYVTFQDLLHGPVRCAVRSMQHGQVCSEKGTPHVGGEYVLDESATYRGFRPLPWSSHAKEARERTSMGNALWISGGWPTLTTSPPKQCLRKPG